MTLFDERPLRPMLAKTGEPFDSDGYIFEPKWDGLRALLFKVGNRIELQNRNLRDVTGGYPELKALNSSISAKRTIIDGEAVVLGPNGTPDFHQLQNRFGINDIKRAEVLRKTTPVTYVAFDLLHINGRDVISNPLEERKKKLKTIIHEGPHLLYADHVEVQGKRFFEEALKKGFEGIIGKERGSPYQPGVRSSTWVKVKGTKTMDCIVVGFTRGERSRASTFGSLVVAAYDQKGELRHLGNVGGGLNNQTLESLSLRLSKLVRKNPVLGGPVEAPSSVSWVKPSLVCEVKFMNFTTDGKLRFPRFSRLRTDKKPEDCSVDL